MINRALLKSELEELFANPVSWFQAIGFHAAMFIALSFLVLIGAGKKQDFWNSYVLFSGTAFWLMMTIVSASYIFTKPKISRTMDALLVSPMPVAEFMNTGILACALFNTVNLVMHFLIAMRYMHLPMAMQTGLALAGCFSLGMALLFVLARLALNMDSGEQLNGYIALCIMALIIFLALCNTLRVDMRISAPQLAALSVILLAVFIASFKFASRKIEKEEIVREDKGTARMSKASAYCRRNLSAFAENPAVKLWQALFPRNALRTNDSAKYGRNNFLFFMRQASFATLKIPFIYVVAALPVWPAIWLTDLHAEEMSAASLALDFAGMMPGLLTLLLLISIYQCATQIFTEDKRNNIVSEFLCSPATGHQLVLGKALGIAIAVFAVTIAIVFAELAVLKPVFFAMFINAAGFLMLARLSVLTIIFSLFFTLCVLAVKDRRFANIALLGVPFLQWAIAKAANLAHSPDMLRRYSVEYGIMICIWLALYVLYLSKRRILEAESALHI
ncbi:MAG: hypothetical protein WC421_06600 [Elusimicrobiales bacterium]